MVFSTLWRKTQQSLSNVGLWSTLGNWFRDYSFMMLERWDPCDKFTWKPAPLALTKLCQRWGQDSKSKRFQRLVPLFSATSSLGTGCLKPMGAANFHGWCNDLLQVVARNWIKIFHCTSAWGTSGHLWSTSAALLCGTSAAAPLQHLLAAPVAQ